MWNRTKCRTAVTGLALRNCWPILVLMAFGGIQAYAYSGAWTPKASAPTNMGSACVVNGKIYVVGGSTNYSLADLANCQVYDPATNTWDIKAPMPTARGFLSSAAVGGLVYAMGGGYPVAKRAVEAYDPVTNSWTSKANLLSPRLGAHAAVVNGIIYNIGGNYNENNCEAYDTATNTWTAKAPVPGSGGALSVIAYNGVIYAFGGSTYPPWAARSNVYAYDPQADAWTPKRSMPTPRFALQTYLVNGKIYALGGSRGENNVLSTMEVYDPVSDTWETKPGIPVAIGWLTGAVVNDKIYVIGGSSDWSTTKLSVWEYDPAFHKDIAAGDVSGTWGVAYSPYFINGEIRVPNDSTLTIDPGVEVVFMGHYKLNIQGRILAIGTQTDSIRFTVQDQVAGWHGVRFINTPSVNDTSKLSYCSFKYGKANTGSGDDRCGGAMMIRAFDKVVVSNCLFDFNMQSGTGWTPVEAGGAIYIENASPVIAHSTFSNNTGTKGSAIVFENSSHATVSRNVLVGNTGGYGPVVFDGGGSPAMSDNIISDNFAHDGGGGILLGNGSTPRIENNIIVHNQAPPGGGGIGCWTNGNAVIINNTIAHNYGRLGGGIFCAYDSDPILINNIVYGNWATSGNQLYIEDDNSEPMVAYCDIEGGKDGFGGPGAGASYTGHYEHNTDAEPLFADTASGNYRLSDSSPCIGAGIDSIQLSGAWYHAPPRCFGGNARPSPQGSKPDLGAFENPLGLIDEVGASSEASPNRFSLEQNYPNPFNPTTVIRYSVPSSTGRDLVSTGGREGQVPGVSAVKIVVYDLLGREAAVLVNERKAPGRYEVKFDGSRLSSGVYFYRLQAGNYVETKRLLLLK